ncbi:DEAD/DEAH box helicase [Agathobacter sp.]
MQEKLILKNGEYNLKDTMTYPNGGTSYFYVHDDRMIVIDDNICNITDQDTRFDYSLITDKQNNYMKQYAKLFRFLKSDIDTIDDVLDISEKNDGEFKLKSTVNRENNAETSPLEWNFEKNFADVYGRESLKYLWKEYGISDWQGNNYFLDYFIHAKSGDIAVEENGVNYHHPQIIGEVQYRRQLQKQNTCAAWGIKLYRFSTDDCRFDNRIEDDIRMFFGENTEDFEENGIIANRSFKLYEHQENTLDEIKRQRKNGVKTFLVVFPTASGKSKIIEEDIKEFSEKYDRFKALILAPNTNIIDDWKERINSDLYDLKENIEVKSFAYMVRNYSKIKPDAYKYIVVDEAHHAVAPVLKRVIQYFTPDFLIGLTATDKRPDKKKLEDVFGSYKTSLSLIEAMEKGIVAEANVYRIETNLDLSHIRFNGKDYVNADLEKSIRVTSRNELIADVIEQYFCGEQIEKRQGVIFCANTAHTVEMEKILNSRGITAKSYTGKSKNPAQIMSEFKAGKIRFLCACDMISEGWDYPELGILVMGKTDPFKGALSATDRTWTQKNTDQTECYSGRCS